MSNTKTFIAEFIGTFALVAIGIAAEVNFERLGWFGVALAVGLTVTVFAYAYEHISGAHFNPAITLGLAANGKIAWGDAFVYWFAQLSGAGIAAAVLRPIFLQFGGFTEAAITGNLISRQLTFQALGVEALLTFFLMNIFWFVGVDKKAGAQGSLAIGLMMTVAILGGGSLTGASLNPARSFGPALFLGTFNFGTPDFLNPNFYLVYFMGPFIGAILATMLYNFLKAEPAEETLEAVAPAEEKPLKRPAVRKVSARKTVKK